jgi:hypothetical protein
VKLFDPRQRRGNHGAVGLKNQTCAHLIDVLANAFQAYAKETWTLMGRVITIARR